MCFFKKKKNPAEKNKNDRDLVEMNSKSIETLVVLADGNNEFIVALKKLQEQLKYLTPSSSDKVYNFDKKIKDQIEDLKIALTKNSDVNSNAKVKGLFQDIKVLITERNAVL